jgi:hypothetical protein
MKKLIISTLAVLALTATANATDLPNKKKAPEAPKAVAAEPAKPAASNDSLTVSYGQDLGNNLGAKVDDAYGVTYKHNLGGGFSVSGVASTTQDTSNVVKQNLEAQAGYALPAFAGIAVSGKVGIGERFVSTGNFPYYALYGAADYKLVDGLTINAINYRYRSAVDTGTYGYQSHRLGTGVTYDITSNYSVNVGFTRSYDTNWNATGDAVTGAFTVKF